MAAARDAAHEKLIKYLKTTHLSGCAKKYAEAMFDPFGAEDGCLPANIINVPSRKMKTRVQGVMSTGTAEVGFVLVRPGQMVVNATDSTPDGEYAVTYSDANYAGSSATTLIATTGVFGEMSNSDYRKGQFNEGGPNTSSLRWRLVSCGVEIENVTALIQRGGSVVGLVEPNHNGLDGYDAGSLLRSDSAFRCGVSGSNSTFQLKWNGPAQPEEMDYASFVGEVSGSFANSACNPCMVFLVTSPRDSPQTYNIKVVAHFELIGQAARGKTSNFPDTQGAAVVSSIAASANLESGNENEDHHSTAWYNAVLDSFGSYFRQAATYGVRMAPAAISAYRGRYAEAAAQGALGLMTAQRMNTIDARIAAADERKKKAAPRTVTRKPTARSAAARRK